MGTLRCPMCGKINPEELDSCRYCHARLKPLVFSSDNPDVDKNGTKILDEGNLPGTKKLDLPEDDADWLGALRDTPQAPDTAPPVRPFIDESPTEKGNSPEDTPDWLENVRRKSAQDGILGKPGLGVPDLSRRAPFSGPVEEPGWLEDLRFEQEPPPPEKPRTARPPETARLDEADLPADWISRLAPQQPPPAQLPGTRPLVDGEEPGNLDFGASFKPGDLPDWLQEISALSESSSPSPDEPRDLSEELPRLLGIVKEKPADVQPPASEAAVTTPEEELPEWVRQFRSRTGPQSPPPPEPTAPQNPDTAPLVWPDEQLPDVWGTKPPIEMPPPPRYGVEQPQQPEEKVPEWLSSLEDRSGWMAQPMPGQAAEPAAGPSDSDMAALPGWLGELTPAVEDIFGSPETGSSQAGARSDNEWPAQAELPSWIQAMRPIETAAITSAAPAEEEPRVEATGPLAGLHGALSLEPVVPEYTRPPVYSLQLQVTERQRLHGELFQDLLAGESKPAVAPVEPLISSQRILRVIIAVALLAGVIVPMVTGIQIFPIPTTPPAEVLHLQESVAGIPEGASVLLAVDYSPAVTGEMEAAAAGLVDQLMARGTRLTLISTSPSGPALARHLLEKVYENPQAYMEPYVRGEKVATLGYLAGGTAGLAGFAQHPQFAAPFTVEGNFAWEHPALQGVTGLAGFARIVVLTESLETGRAWIEQVGTEFNQPGSLLVVASAQSAPLLRPYVESGQAGGMVAGLSGGAAYEKLVGRSGPGGAYWNAFQGGLWVSILLILGGVLVNGIRIVLRLQNEKSEAAL